MTFWAQSKRASWVREPGGRAFQAKALSQERIGCVSEIKEGRLLFPSTTLGNSVGKLGRGQNMLCLMYHGQKSGFYVQCNGQPLMICFVCESDDCGC